LRVTKDSRVNGWHGSETGAGENDAGGVHSARQ